MRVGYARVSTADQNPDLQEDALHKAGCEKIFRDVASGAVDSRRGLAEAIDYAREGDTLVVWKLDRLGRSLKHLIETVNRLAARKIGFQSLRESMDTTTSGGKLIFHVFGALADRTGTHPRADSGRTPSRSGTGTKWWPASENGRPEDQHGSGADGKPECQYYGCLRYPARIPSNAISSPRKSCG